MATFNFTGKKKITDQSIFSINIKISEDTHPEIKIDLKKSELEKFGKSNHIVIEAYYKHNIQYFDLGEIDNFEKQTLKCTKFSPWESPRLRFKIVDMSSELFPVVAYRNNLSAREENSKGVVSSNFLNPKIIPPDKMAQRAWCIDWNHDKPELWINRDLGEIIAVKTMFNKDTEHPEFRLLILPEFFTQALRRILMNSDRDDENNEYIIKARELNGSKCPRYTEENEIEIEEYIEETVKKMTEKFNLMKIYIENSNYNENT
tara:strand:+ start:49 stop:831 length:783 start_codon:yes stop_codon:yes gene_type:complete